MHVLETDRLVLRWLCADDAAFILQLVNEPSWLRFIGDRGVRTLDDARAYLAKGPIGMYRRLGFGLYLTALKESGTPVGICGLIKRDGLDEIDLGFAFLPAFWGRGYAHESAAAVMAHGQTVFGLSRLVALTALDNDRSIRLLEKLGFRFKRTICLSADGPESRLFAYTYPPVGEG